MHLTMTAINMSALLGSMAVLAAVPSVSVLTVSARAASHGFLHGLLATLGILAGDIFYILLAVFGLALIVESAGTAAFLIPWLGGAYMIWLGLRLWRSAAMAAGTAAGGEASLLSSFLSGLLVTLADQKVVLFYLGFLPAFIDLDRITLADTLAIVAITVVAVGGVKLGYAYAARTAGTIMGPAAGNTLNRVASIVIIAVGTFLVVRSLW